jgi:hypothetical protein
VARYTRLAVGWCCSVTCACCCDDCSVRACIARSAVVAPVSGHEAPRIHALMGRFRRTSFGGVFAVSPKRRSSSGEGRADASLSAQPTHPPSASVPTRASVSRRSHDSPDRDDDARSAASTSTRISAVSFATEVTTWPAHAVSPSAASYDTVLSGWADVSFTTAHTDKPNVTTNSSLSAARRRSSVALINPRRRSSIGAFWVGLAPTQSSLMCQGRRIAVEKVRAVHAVVLTHPSCARS